eukprot:s1907_g12.t1
MDLGEIKDDVPPILANSEGVARIRFTQMDVRQFVNQLAKSDANREQSTPSSHWRDELMRQREEERDTVLTFVATKESMRSNVDVDVMRRWNVHGWQDHGEPRHFPR